MIFWHVLVSFFANGNKNKAEVFKNEKENLFGDIGGVSVLAMYR